MSIESKVTRIVLYTAAAALLGASPIASADEPAKDPTRNRQYTFSWQFSEDDAMRPRGGSSRGTPVELATKPDPSWFAVQEPGLTPFERDRRAILAMAGGYRTSFDFLETVRFVPNAEQQRPYQSWGTEYVVVTEDSGDYISLQHIIVMFFVEEDGSTSQPIVTKHWRQDWQYEDRQLLTYAGDSRWQTSTIDADTAAGTWTQSVFQVDDAPRYESFGRWEHNGNFSSWTGEPTWRPLPRREYSVRVDYDVLEATNTHTLVPTGWVHEQNNLKLDLDDNGQPVSDAPYLARELGVNRYEHLVGFDFSAGQAWWSRTEAFWADVRSAWDRKFDQHERFAIASHVDGMAIYEHFFGFADSIEPGDCDRRAARRMIDSVLDAYVVPVP